MANFKNIVLPFKLRLKPFAPPYFLIRYLNYYGSSDYPFIIFLVVPFQCRQSPITTIKKISKAGQFTLINMIALIPYLGLPLLRKLCLRRYDFHVFYSDHNAVPHCNGNILREVSLLIYPLHLYEVRIYPLTKCKSDLSIYGRTRGVTSLAVSPSSPMLRDYTLLHSRQEY